jgi:hypothetical protein
MEADNALEFDFEVKTLLNSLMPVQTADTTYPPYDTSLIGPAIAVPGKGAGAADARKQASSHTTTATRGGGARLQDGGKAILDSTFSKACPWVGDKMIEPQMVRMPACSQCVCLEVGV